LVDDCGRCLADVGRLRADPRRWLTDRVVQATTVVDGLPTSVVLETTVVGASATPVVEATTAVGASPTSVVLGMTVVGASPTSSFSQRPGRLRTDSSPHVIRSFRLDTGL